ncbi:MAG: VWA domain-containing protein [Aeromicrobium sp.]|uniref:vWA domain-containing protein n=1 Tax=Aeromicrobium sp. TaxID=1871063 RepID=UPI0039E72A3C
MSSWVVRRVVVGVVVLLALSACGGESETRALGEEPELEVPAVPTVMVLDASASMLADDAPGVRFEAAQVAVTSLVDALPEEHELGLVVYGTETGTAESELEAGCEDVSVLVELGPLDKADYTSTVDSLEPRGFTPMGKALRTAAAELPGEGERAIVIVSDGEDHCGAAGLGDDPCEVAADLEGITVHTVGFKTAGNTIATEQLDCVAEKTGGLALDAANPAQLEARLPAVLNPEWAASTIQPAGYRGVRPGMTVEEATLAAEAAGEELPEVEATGTVEVVYVDCTLVFEDGVLARVVSDNEDMQTIDGVRVGDDITEAEELYGLADTPSTPTDEGTVVYEVDPDLGTGYEIAYKPKAAGELAGEITQIILCLCLPEPEEVTFDPAVTVASSADLGKLVGASQDFKDLIRETLNELQGQGAWEGCPANSGINVFRYRSDGYALGDDGHCEMETRYLWALRDGVWVALDFQPWPGCDQLREVGWPPEVFGPWECFDESGELVPYTG